MPRVTYNGHDPDGVEIVVDGRTILAEKGKHVEVPAEVRDELVKREDWSEVKPPKKDKE